MKRCHWGFGDEMIVASQAVLTLLVYETSNALVTGKDADKFVIPVLQEVQLPTGNRDVFSTCG